LIYQLVTDEVQEAQFPPICLRDKNFHLSHRLRCKTSAYWNKMFFEVCIVNWQGLVIAYLFFEHFFKIQATNCEE
jgi:hypothetical protein